MKTTIAEICVWVTVGEMRQATAEIEVPEGTSWEDVSDLVKAFKAGYAKLWGADVRSVHATIAIAVVTRDLLRYGDVR